jgi:UDP-N-acetylglucosamine acyltransferase
LPIHPTAIVDRHAEVDPSAEIGPYVVIEGAVRIGPRTRVMAHAYLTGRTEIGPDNVIHPGASIGHEPMDLAYRDAPTGLRIGARNVFREHSEVHRATQADTWTEIGDDNYLMSRAHVAHNCIVADRVIVCSGALVAGHAVLGDQAFISGNCLVHQFVRVGRLAIMRGGSRTSRDVPPFAMIDGTHTVRGINRVGLRRAGLEPARIRLLATAFRILFHTRTNLKEAMARVEAELRSPEVDELLAFIRTARRGVASGPARPGPGVETGAEDETE